MFGRQTAAHRPGGHGRRWIAAAAGLAVAGATVLAMAPADAATVAPVVATFGLTGVTTSNCPSLSTGGADIWVTPGGELDFKTSLASVNLLGLPLSTSPITGLDGKLVIANPTGTPATTVDVQTTTVAKLSTLSTGDHAYTFKATDVNVGGLPLPIPPVGAGLSLTWSGTIHVTADAAQCGVSVATPGVTLQLPGMAPIVVLPQVTVPTIAVPNLVPTTVLPIPGKSSTTPAAGKQKPTSTYTGMPVTIPELVVPKGDGPANGGTANLPAFGGQLPAVGGALSGVPAPLAGSSASPQPNSSIAADQQSATAQPQATTGMASNASSAQMPVLLAIIAIIALSLVTATYARLFLVRKP